MRRQTPGVLSGRGLSGAGGGPKYVQDKGERRRALGACRADEVMTEAELETEMEGCDDEERMERIVRRLSPRQLVAN